MNLDELRSVQSKERRKDSLQQLRNSFYEDVAAYIGDLQATRDRRAEQVEKPFSDDEVRRLSDEIETAEEVAEAVYERRVGKVVKLASFAAADMSVGKEGLTSEEQELFDDLVERIKQNKHTVLEILAGTSPTADPPAEATSSTTADTPSTDTPSTDTPPTTSEPTETASAAESETMLAEAMGSSSKPDDESASTQDDKLESTAKTAEPPVPTTDGGNATNTGHVAVEPQSTSSTEPTAAAEPTTSDSTVAAKPAQNDVATAGTGRDTDTSDTEPPATDQTRTTLRITEDVGEIFGVDEREYTLRSEDVVTLPSANAEALLKQNAAMRLD